MTYLYNMDRHGCDRVVVGLYMQPVSITTNVVSSNNTCGRGKDISQGYLSDVSRRKN